MSDHSNHEESQNPVARLFGVLFLFAVPASLITMLGVVGFSFVSGVRATPPPTPPVVPGAKPEFDLALGKSTYATCMACHGPDAKGVKIGAVLMAPNLVGSELLLHENPDVSALILLKGIQKEGMEYMGMMAGLGAALDDEKIAAVLSYTRTSFGNSGSVITTEQVAATRAKFADLDTPAGIKRADVLKTAGAE